MVLASVTRPPLMPILSSAAPWPNRWIGRFCATKSYGEPPFPSALQQDVWDDIIKSPHYATQTTSTPDPATRRLTSNTPTSTSANYEANLAKINLGNLVWALVGAVCISDHILMLLSWFPLLENRAIAMSLPLQRHSCGCNRVICFHNAMMFLCCDMYGCRLQNNGVTATIFLFLLQMVSSIAMTFRSRVSDVWRGKRKVILQPHKVVLL